MSSMEASAHDRDRLDERAEWEGMVEELLEGDGSLSGWEIDFVESIADRLDRGDELTDAQVDKLREVWSDRQ